MDEALVKGLDELKWNAPEEVEKFINNAKIKVDSTYEVVTRMRESKDKIRKCLDNINTKILERKSRPMPPDDFDQIHKAVFNNKISIIKENDNQIHKLLREVLDAVKIDKKSAIWKAYIDYINEILLEGIARAIMTALQHLNDQINPHFIKRYELQPIFEIRLELNSNEIMYDPVIEETNGVSVRNFVKGWINDFFQLSLFIKRLDKIDPSDFLQEMRDFFELKEALSSIYINLESIENETKEFKKKFNTYSYLWKNDPVENFEQFLIENEPPDEEDEELEQKENPLLKGCRKKIPDLDLFDDKITNLKNVQQEINKITTPYEIAWLKINIQPLKSDLNKKVISWINVYTNFLVTEYRATLKNYKEFMKVTNEGIRENPVNDEENKELLMKVMKIISDVKDVEPKADKIVRRMKDMIVKLKKHGVLNIQEKGEEEPLQSIDNAHALFNETTQKVFKVKAEILPLQTRETIEIKNRLEKFSKKVIVFRQEFLDNLPFRYHENDPFESINYSYDLIDQYYSKRLEIENEAQQYNNLEKLFELEKSGYFY